MKYRCKVCGQIVDIKEGDRCPICGADFSKLEPLKIHMLELMVALLILVI